MGVLVEGPAEGGTQDRAGLSCRLVPGEPCRDLPGAVRALRWGQPFGPGRSRLAWGLWCPVPGRAVLSQHLTAVRGQEGWLGHQPGPEVRARPTSRSQKRGRVRRRRRFGETAVLSGDSQELGREVDGSTRASRAVQELDFPAGCPHP